MAVRKRPLSHAGTPTHGVEQAIGRVNTIKHLGYFAAEKAARDGVGRVARDLDGTFAAVGARGHGDQHAATIGAIK